MELWSNKTEKTLLWAARKQVKPEYVYNPASCIFQTNNNREMQVPVEAEPFTLQVIQKGEKDWRQGKARG